MQTRRRAALLVIVDNALFQSMQHINQTLPQIIYILHFCLIDWLLNFTPDFVVKKGQGCSATTNLEVHRVT